MAQVCHRRVMNWPPTRVMSNAAGQKTIGVTLRIRIGGNRIQVMTRTGDPCGVGQSEPILRGRQIPFAPRKLLCANSIGMRLLPSSNDQVVIFGRRRRPVDSVRRMSKGNGTTKNLRCRALLLTRVTRMATHEVPALAQRRQPAVVSTGDPRMRPRLTRCFHTCR